MTFTADRVAGLAVASAGALVALASLGIDVGGGRLTTLSARFAPLALSAALIALGAMLALRPGQRLLSEVVGAIVEPRTAAFAGLLLVYFLTFRYVDFRLGAWAFLLASMAVLGVRRPLVLLIVPPAAALGVYAVFRHAFMILLPVWS